MRPRIKFIILAQLACLFLASFLVNRIYEQSISKHVDSVNDHGYFIVVNDIHGNPRYKKRGIIKTWKDCITKTDATTSNSELPLVPFLHECDAPIDIIYSMFEYIKTNFKVDFLIWLGDTMVHYPENEFDEDFVATYLGNISEYIHTMLPNVPVYPVFGNHDQKPHSVLGPELYSKYYHKFYYKSKWNLFFANNRSTSAKDDFLKGGYYSFEIDNQTTGLVLNTLIYYLKNDLVDERLHDDPLGQFNWLETQLEIAKSKSIRILIVIHFPPGKYEFDIKYNSSFKLKYHNKFISTIATYGDTIVGMIMAHLHVDTFRLYETHRSSHVSAIPGWVQPSVSTYFKNPAFRVYKYDKKTRFGLIDYDQYYFNLTEANQKGFIDWKLEYTFSSAYNQPSGLNGNTMKAVVQAMKSNQTVFDQFLRYLRVGLPINETLCKPWTCQKLFLCIIEHADVNKYDECLTENNKIKRIPMYQLN